MANVNIPNRPSGSDTRAIAAILADFDAITNFLNGENLDSNNLSEALNQKLGVSSTSGVRRGKSIIATEESRTNTAYGLLTTPDRVQGVVLPADSLLCIAYAALWKESIANAARAAVFIGATQLAVNHAGLSSVQAARTPNAIGVGTYGELMSDPIGLVAGSPASHTSIATGPIAVVGGADANDNISFEIGSTEFESSGNTTRGGVILVRAPAGTYDVSVQFKASSGSVTAKERKLWVWTMGF